VTADLPSKAPPRRRLLLWLPVVAMMGTQFFLSSQSRLPAVLPSFRGVDKLAHATWFLLLGFLAYRAGREAEGWSRRRTVAALLFAAAFWGASDEGHQSFVPGRAVEAADLAADVAGAALAALLAEPILRRLGLLGSSR
jgi:VanZ family protein